MRSKHNGTLSKEAILKLFTLCVSQKNIDVYSILKVYVYMFFKWVYFRHKTAKKGNTERFSWHQNNHDINHWEDYQEQLIWHFLGCLWRETTWAHAVLFYWCCKQMTTYVASKLFCIQHLAVVHALLMEQKPVLAVFLLQALVETPEPLSSCLASLSSQPPLSKRQQQQSSSYCVVAFRPLLLPLTSEDFFKLVSDSYG